MSASSISEADLDRAAAVIAGAEALLVGAGAGMGVDSGLPDFRGDKGFWNAYPPYRRLGVSFVEMANPQWFASDSSFAWGFYGHRRNLYRTTTPHRGFEILRRWGERMRGGAFVYTSNVDGQFQRAGFDPEAIDECHGALDYEQCMNNCGSGIYAAAEAPVEVDETSMRAVEPLPRCPACGGLSRPNVLMFGDWAWLGEREREQSHRLHTWLHACEGPLAVVECGAGTAVPSVRWFCERGGHGERTLIRINPREPQAPRGGIGLAGGALAVLEAIDARLPS